MLTLIKVNIDMGLRASENFDHVLTLVILALPSIHKMENIMIGQFKPLDFLWIGIVSFHDSVSCRLILIKLEDELTFNNEIGPEFHWQIRNYNVTFSYGEIVDHPSA